MPGDPLAALIAQAAKSSAENIGSTDVLVVSQKVVSKAEGRLRELIQVTVSKRAQGLAAKLNKEPRLTQVILDESREIIRADNGVLICEHRSGHVCANAGVDLSNSPGDEIAVLLPVDPDASARQLRADLGRTLCVRPAIVIADSFGRPWRIGQTDVAIGCAGLLPLDDWRSRADSRGRQLTATVAATADDVAAAAGLVRSKDGGNAVVTIRGLDHRVSEEDGPGARVLLRQRTEDLFRES